MLVEIERFIDWVRMRSPQARTWRDYKCDLALFVTVVGDLNADAIQPREIDDFVNYQIREGYNQAP
jgi:hypothetical protein